MKDFLTWLWEKLMECLPFVVIGDTDWGVVMRGGRILDEPWTSRNGVRGTGLHFRIPFWTEIMPEPRMEYPIDLPVCNVTTADGKKVSLSGNVTILIVDPVRMWRTVHDNDASVTTKAAGLLAEYGAEYKWTSLRHDRQNVRLELRKKLSRSLKRWGVRVVGVEFTDFVEAQQINLFGSLM